MSGSEATNAAAVLGTSLVEGKQITKGVSLLRALSSGGMGAVWLADHHGLKTRVVVKFMLGTLDSSESARTRFSREAAAAAQVKSPHVVQMLDHGVSDDGVPFIVMEHLEGHDLGDEIEQHGALDIAKVVTVISQVAKALSKVHSAGLLHRDIKPDNIFLVDGEEEVFVKLLDFGIAKSATGGDQGDGSLDGETKTGQIVGTPFYMSPEQVTAQKVIDQRSDLWALGVVAYEALTGKRPYDGPSFGALAVKIATGSPPKPTEANPSLPPAVDLWFAKACARDPGARFANAREMAEAFRAAFEGVVSLPASVISSDSGQRGLSSSSGSRSGSSSGSSPNASSTSGSRNINQHVDGLAETALPDDPSGKPHVALGRSEAGVSVAEDRKQQRSSPLLFIGGAVLLSVVVVAVFVWSAKTNGGANGQNANNGSGSSTTTTSTITGSLASTAPPSTQAPSAVVSSVATVTPVVDAGRGAATTTTTTTTVYVPATRPTVVPTKPTETTAAPSTKPTAKPPSSEPDLF